MSPRKSYKKTGKKGSVKHVNVSNSSRGKNKKTCQIGKNIDATKKLNTIEHDIPEVDIPADAKEFFEVNESLLYGEVPKDVESLKTYLAEIIVEKQSEGSLFNTPLKKKAVASSESDESSQKYFKYKTPQKLSEDIFRPSIRRSRKRYVRKYDADNHVTTDLSDKINGAVVSQNKSESNKLISKSISDVLKETKNIETTVDEKQSGAEITSPKQDLKLAEIIVEKQSEGSLFNTPLKKKAVASSESDESSQKYFKYKTPQKLSKDIFRPSIRRSRKTYVRKSDADNHVTTDLSDKINGAVVSQNKSESSKLINKSISDVLKETKNIETTVDEKQSGAEITSPKQDLKNSKISSTKLSVIKFNVPPDKPNTAKTINPFHCSSVEDIKIDQNRKSPISLELIKCGNDAQMEGNAKDKSVSDIDSTSLQNINTNVCVSPMQSHVCVADFIGNRKTFIKQLKDKKDMLYIDQVFNLKKKSKLKKNGNYNCLENNLKTGDGDISFERSPIRDSYILDSGDKPKNAEEFNEHDTNMSLDIQGANSNNHSVVDSNQKCNKSEICNFSQKSSTVQINKKAYERRGKAPRCASNEGMLELINEEYTTSTPKLQVQETISSTCDNLQNVNVSAIPFILNNNDKEKKVTKSSSLLPEPHVSKDSTKRRSLCDIFKSLKEKGIRKNIICPKDNSQEDINRSKVSKYKNSSPDKYNMAASKCKRPILKASQRNLNAVTYDDDHSTFDKKHTSDLSPRKKIKFSPGESNLSSQSLKSPENRTNNTDFQEVMGNEEPTKTSSCSRLPSTEGKYQFVQSTLQSCALDVLTENSSVFQKSNKTRDNLKVNSLGKSADKEKFPVSKKSRTIASIMKSFGIETENDSIHINDSFKKCHNKLGFTKQGNFVSKNCKKSKSVHCVNDSRSHFNAISNENKTLTAVEDISCSERNLCVPACNESPLSVQQNIASPKTGLALDTLSNSVSASNTKDNDTCIDGMTILQSNKLNSIAGNQPPSGESEINQRKGEIHLTCQNSTPLSFSTVSPKYQNNLNVNGNFIILAKPALSYPQYGNQTFVPNLNNFVQPLGTLQNASSNYIATSFNSGISPQTTTISLYQAEPAFCSASNSACNNLPNFNPIAASKELYLNNLMPAFFNITSTNKHMRVRDTKGKYLVPHNRFVKQEDILKHEDKTAVKEDTPVDPCLDNLMSDAAKIFAKYKISFDIPVREVYDLEGVGDLLNLYANSLHEFAIISGNEYLFPDLLLECPLREILKDYVSYHINDLPEIPCHVKDLMEYMYKHFASRDCYFLGLAVSLLVPEKTEPLILIDIVRCFSFSGLISIFYECKKRRM